jgi:hypothetical protein
MIAVRESDRLQDKNVHRILDHPPCIARCQLDVSDNGVARIIGIDFAECAHPDFLVLANLAKRHALKGRRLDSRDDDSCDVRVGASRQSQAKHENGTHPMKSRPGQQVLRGHRCISL